ncbi:MAG: DUF4870 domain-containing protein [Thermoguttaceae bacterium]
MERENAYDSPAAELPESPEALPDVRPEERTWGMLAHLSGLLIFAMPLANIAGPLVVWLIKKDEMPFVDDQAKEALNFQISATIYIILAGVSALALIGFVLFPAALLFHLIFTILAALKANEGVCYRYPLCIRFVS